MPSKLLQMAMRNPDASIFTSIFHACSYFFHSGYVLYTTYWHQDTWYQKIKTQTQKHLVCWLPTELSGLFRVSTGAKRAAMVGWIRASRRRPGPHGELERAPRIKPRSFLALCSPFRTQDEASSLHWFHVRAIRDDTRRLQAWFGDGLCISAFTVTDAPGNQQKIFEERDLIKSEHS